MHQQLAPGEWTDAPCPGAHPATTPITGQPVWCLPCEARIGVALAGPRGIAELTALAASRRDGRLLERAPKQLAVVKVAPTPASPSPGWEEVDDVTAWADAWCQRIALQMGRTAATGTERPDLVHCLAYLTRWLRPALVGRHALDFGHDVLTKHRRLQHLSGERPTLRVLKVACPACDQRGLIREEGADRIDCRLCGGLWTEDTFQVALDAQHHEPTPPRAITRPVASARARSYGGRA